MHDASPVDGCFVPVGQLMHAANPSWFPYMPVEQTSHDETSGAATVVEYLPKPHFRQVLDVVAPFVVLYVPAGHPLQSVVAFFPTTSLYVPGPQLMHVFVLCWGKVL